MSLWKPVAGPAGALWRRWLSHNYWDALLVLLVVGGHGLAVRFGDWHPLMGSIPEEKRPGLYGASAVVVSLTGTLVSVTVAQYLSGRGERVKFLKAAFPGELSRTWIYTFVGSMTAAALFLTAYGLDSRPGAGPTGSWVFEVGVVLAALRFVRLAALFGELVHLIVLDDTDPAVNQTPQISDEVFEDQPAPALRN